MWKGEEGSRFKNGSCSVGWVMILVDFIASFGIIVVVFRFKWLGFLYFVLVCIVAGGFGKV